jgi:hypothetical protein
LQNLDPKDNAINHQIGDLKGMWRITFNKKDLIA